MLSLQWILLLGLLHWSVLADLGDVDSNKKVFRNKGLKTSWQKYNDLLPQLEPGDIIEFQRTKGVVLFYNHAGIADGKEGIYHFGAPPESTLKAGKHQVSWRHDNIAKVAKSDKTRINNSSDKTMDPLPPYEIINRCKKRLNEQCEDDYNEYSYNLITNNCEHNALKMRYGYPSSPQADKLWNYVTLIFTVDIIFVVLFCFGVFRHINKQAKR